MSAVFQGYLRPDGRKGIRNYVLILSSVGCANHVVERIAQAVPGCVAIPNVKGCGQVGKGIEIMRRCLVNLTEHPNVYGTIMVGLGCETTKPYELEKVIRARSSKPLHVMTIQEAGGSLKAIEKGIELARAMVAEAQDPALAPRVDMTLGDIVLGTNCGGSDATSGLAANPVIGEVADAVVAAGGSVLLGETTELIGTEHILASRAATPEVADAIYRIVGGLEKALDDAGVDIRGANPSPGNMAGGLSTLEEKALGGIDKGGTTPIQDVINYGEQPRRPGLTIMDTPGFDIESVSGMCAGGAQLLVFSSGRGTPIGNPLMPVIKITGNHRTFVNMEDNIDFDASGVLRGTSSIEADGGALLDMVEDVCAGKQTKAEVLGMHDFAIYHTTELWCNCEG